MVTAIDFSRGCTVIMVKKAHPTSDHSAKALCSPYRTSKSYIYNKGLKTSVSLAYRNRRKHSTTGVDMKLLHGRVIQTLKNFQIEELKMKTLSSIIHPSDHIRLVVGVQR